MPLSYINNVFSEYIGCKIFDSVKQASKFYNIKSYSNISRCCAGKLKSCGKLEDGTPLRWMYYKDYLKQQ